MEYSNDEIYRCIQRDGVKKIIKNYVTNLTTENWMVWTNGGDVFLLNEEFFKFYSLIPIFKESFGELYFEDWDLKKYSKRIRKRLCKEQ